VLETIETLVHGWPEVVSIKDQNGFLPLHYVCQNETEKQSLDIIMLLVQTSNDTLEVVTTCGSLLLHFACTKPISSVEVIGYLIGMCPCALHFKDDKE